MNTTEIFELDATRAAEWSEGEPARAAIRAMVLRLAAGPGVERIDILAPGGDVVDTLTCGDETEGPAPTECAYCARLVRDRGDEPPPAVDDDPAWLEVACDGHALDCEWMVTRAHRRDAPPLAPLRRWTVTLDISSLSASDGERWAAQDPGPGIVSHGADPRGESERWTVESYTLPGVRSAVEREMQRAGVDGVRVVSIAEAA